MSQSSPQQPKCTCQACTAFCQWLTHIIQPQKLLNVSWPTVFLLCFLGEFVWICQLMMSRKYITRFYKTVSLREAEKSQGLCITRFAPKTAVKQKQKKIPNSDTNNVNDGTNTVYILMYLMLDCFHFCWMVNMLVLMVQFLQWCEISRFSSSIRILTLFTSNFIRKNIFLIQGFVI